MKCTQYFSFMKSRPDRAVIKEEWIVATISQPLKQAKQSDGRIRKWRYIEEEGVIEMKIRYFTDTDTALIEFSTEAAVETKEISENLYIDLDSKGNLVNMTIEHAKDKANISEVSYLQMDKITA